MPGFATYLYPHTCYTSKPVEQIRFVGHSYPYFNQVRAELAKALADYPTLAVREAAYTDYLSVHTESYLGKLRMMAAGEPVQEPPRLSIECAGLEHCLPGYLYGLGGMLQAIDQMRAGTLERAYCFSLGGHHAYADWGHGYCLLNPAAAATRYAQAQGFDKVLIVDWDIHHGDGTQSIFANDSSVYCISIHSALDMYMAVQRVMRYGTTTAGDQVGHCNIPLLDRSFEDNTIERLSLPGKFYRASESLAVFQAALDHVPWPPDLTFIFSGYDSHRDDCGKNTTDWTEPEYRLLTQYVLKLAKRASCPVLSIHGGGYKLPTTLSAAVSHIEVLANCF